MSQRWRDPMLDNMRSSDVPMLERFSSLLFPVFKISGEWFRPGTVLVGLHGVRQCSKKLKTPKRLGSFAVKLYAQLLCFFLGHVAPLK